MVATVFNLTSASSTVHYFRREGHGLGTPANDPGYPEQVRALSGAGDEAEDYYARKGD